MLISLLVDPDILMLMFSKMPIFKLWMIRIDLIKLLLVARYPKGASLFDGLCALKEEMQGLFKKDAPLKVISG